MSLLPIIEGLIALVIAIKVDSASLSLIFLATVQPSQNKVEAGILPPPTVIGPAISMPFFTSSLTPSASTNVAALLPHIFIIATFPALNSALVALLSCVRKSGFIYADNAFIISRAFTPDSEFTFGSAVLPLKWDPP